MDIKVPFGLSRRQVRAVFRWVLILIALHSIGFGICLILFPCSVLQYFGFEISQKFFATQGGVFHLIISYAYLRAAFKPEHSEEMVSLACLAKFAATLFLISYYFFGTPILMVLISGFLDFLMGLAILYTYLVFRASERQVRLQTA
jgi:hypothetical protein